MSVTFSGLGFPGTILSSVVLKTCLKFSQLYGSNAASQQTSRGQFLLYLYRVFPLSQRLLRAALRLD